MLNVISWADFWGRNGELGMAPLRGMKWQNEEPVNGLALWDSSLNKERT